MSFGRLKRGFGSSKTCVRSTSGGSTPDFVPRFDGSCPKAGAHKIRLSKTKTTGILFLPSNKDSPFFNAHRRQFYSS
jgi:hypothetical protein